MSVEENLGKVDALIEAFNAHDIERWIGFHAESIVHHGPGLPEPLEGREALHEFAHSLVDAFPDIHWEKERAFGQGDWVTLEIAVHGTHKGPIEGPSGEPISVTDQSVRFRDCIVFTFEGGEITEEREYYDQLGLLTQLGMAP